MNLRSLDKKTVLLMAAVCAAVIVCLVLIIPLTGKIRRADHELQVLESELRSARQVLLLGKKFRPTQVMPNRRQIPLVIDEITKVAAAQDVTFLSINPKDITKKQGTSFSVLPIQMQLRSTYRDLGMFLGDLEELNTSVVTVQKLYITQAPQFGIDMKTELVVEVYLKGGADG